MNTARSEKWNAAEIQPEIAALDYAQTELKRERKRFDKD